jgi:hypothetical protein
VEELNWNKISIKKVTNSISERWKNFGRIKSINRKTKNEKQRTFSLDFYFSDTDSAYCSLCPSDWNPLEFSGNFSESEINLSVVSITNPLKKISQSFQTIFTSSLPVWNQNKADQKVRHSSFQESGVCSSYDQMLDDIDFVSLCSIPPIATSPPPILKPDSFSDPGTLEARTKPHKTVSLLLPAKNIAEDDLFGVHLQLETVETVLLSPGQKGDISSQQRQILCQARQQMEKTFPFLSFTIHILFSDNLVILLQSISPSMIGDLILQIKTILFSPLLLTIPFIDIIIHVIMRVLHFVSVLLQSEAAGECYPQRLDELRHRLRMCPCEQGRVACVADIRAAWVQLWCNLLL